MAPPINDEFDLGDPMRPVGPGDSGEKRKGIGTFAAETMGDVSQSTRHGGPATEDESASNISVTRSNSAQPAAVTNGGRREGEIEFVIPEPASASARPLTPEEKRLCEAREQKLEQDRIEALIDGLRPPDSFQVPVSLRKIGMMLLAVVAAGILLFMIGQVTSALNQIASLPVWAQWFVGLLLIVVACVLLYVVVRLILLFLRLRRNRQVHLNGLLALSKREELRSIASQRSQKAVDQLKEYLISYPTEQPRALGNAGLLPEEIEALRASRKILLEMETSTGSQRWIERFVMDFQSVLDGRAKRCIDTYTKEAGIKTAVSPLPLLDNLIVLVLALRMLHDLMIIYHLRGGASTTAQILVRAIAQAYLAGEMQDIAEAITTQICDELPNLIGQTAAKVSKIIGSKAGEGIVNAFMMRKLGFAMEALLQPTRPT